MHAPSNSSTNRVRVLSTATQIIASAQQKKQTLNKMYSSQHSQQDLRKLSSFQKTLDNLVQDNKAKPNVIEQV